MMTYAVSTHGVLAHEGACQGKSRWVTTAQLVGMGSAVAHRHRMLERSLCALYGTEASC